MPKISICIPCYNNPEEMERLLASIASQSMHDFEVCISDDSTDDAVERLIAAFPSLQDKIVYAHNGTPNGHIINWNAAMDMGRGKYIKIMFSDDWFSGPDSLLLFSKMLDDEPDADLAFSGSRQVLLVNSPDDLRCVGDVGRYSEDHCGFRSFTRHAGRKYIKAIANDWRRVFIANKIGAPSATIMRRRGELLHFELEAGYPSDSLLYMEILRRRHRFAHTNKALTCIGVHPGQYSESFSPGDDRLYESARFIYERMRLSDSKECETHMLREYLVPAHKGYGEARDLGIGLEPYLYENARMWAKTAESFLGARLGCTGHGA